MKQLENKVALITGAGSGMGQTHAKVFVERGAAVVINDLNGDGLRETAEIVREAGGRAIEFVGDITKPEFVKTMVDDAISQVGQRDTPVVWSDFREMCRPDCRSSATVQPTTTSCLHSIGLLVNQS